MQRCCGSCGHKHVEENRLYCRRFPPITQSLLVPEGEGLVIRHFTMFPNVHPNSQCGEWKMALVVTDQMPNEHPLLKGLK